MFMIVLCELLLFDRGQQILVVDFFYLLFDA